MHVFVIPEICLTSHDYESLQSEFESQHIICTVFDVWPDHIEQDLISHASHRNDAFKQWVQNTATHAVSKIKSYDDNDIVLFAHVAQEISKQIHIKIALFNCNIIPNFEPNLDMIGLYDDLIKFVDMNRAVTVKCGHFSCLSKESAKKGINTLNKLMHTDFDEEYINACNVIVSHVLSIC